MKNKWTRKGKKLWVYIPEELYDHLKDDAKKRNMTFTRHIIRILLRHALFDKLE
jgi:hypothetical protein